MEKQAPQRVGVLQGTWTCSYCGPSSTALLTVIRSASIFRELQMNFCRCSTVHSIPRCIVWKKEDGERQMGDSSGPKPGIQILPIDGKKARTNLWSKNRSGSRWPKPWARVMWPAAEEAEMKWWQIRKRNEDLERELRSDLELEEEEQRDHGLPRDEARYAARRAFGNTTLIREQTHESWSSAPFERLLQDLRFALRQLRRNPGFTFTATIMLALGIGASVAMFAFVDAALFKPLPYLDPDILVAGL